MIEGLGTRLGIERIKHKLSQQQVAERLGVKRSVVSSYENSVSTPPAGILIKLATLYGVTTDYLLGLKDHQMIVVDGLNQTEIEAVTQIIKLLKEK